MVAAGELSLLEITNLSRLVGFKLHAALLLISCVIADSTSASAASCFNRVILCFDARCICRALVDPPAAFNFELHNWHLAVWLMLSFSKYCHMLLRTVSYCNIAPS